MLSQIEAAAVIEKADRAHMALRLFRPLPHQDEVFSKAAQYTLVLGGNRSGKSTCAAVYFAATALDIPITLSTGEVIRTRHPGQVGKCLKMFCIGINSRHIGETIWRLLCRAGLFQVAYDKEKRELRPYNREKDPERGIKPKASPPLIPARYIESVSWDNRADNVFTKIIVRNPSTGERLAEILAYTSSGKPPQGQPVNGVIWVDEQLPVANYIEELIARLVDDAENGAKIVWSSWPDTNSNELEVFRNIVETNIEQKTGYAAKFTLAMSANKTLAPSAVERFLAGCATQEARDARDKGLFVTEQLRMYPLFDKHIHSAIISPEDGEDELSEVLRQTDGIPPESWTKTLILDPGTKSPAVLLCAVPPPELGIFFVPYQQIYPGRADAWQLAKAVKKEADGQRFYRFIADYRAGRQQTMGMAAGTRVIDSYIDAFEQYGLRCTATKHMFIPAIDDVGGRQMILNGWLYPAPGTRLPQLRIVTHRCPDLVDQLSKVKKRVVQKEEVDERKNRGQWDLVDALEYFAASHPRYISQPAVVNEGSAAYRWYMKTFGKKTERPSITFGH